MGICAQSASINAALKCAILPACEGLSFYEEDRMSGAVVLLHSRTE